VTRPIDEGTRVTLDVPSDPILNAYHPAGPRSGVVERRAYSTYLLDGSLVPVWIVHADSGERIYVIEGDWGLRALAPERRRKSAKAAGPGLFDGWAS